jgi:hypothetical protein
MGNQWEKASPTIPKRLTRDQIDNKSRSDKALDPHLTGNRFITPIEPTKRHTRNLTATLTVLNKQQFLDILMYPEQLTDSTHKNAQQEQDAAQTYTQYLWEYTTYRNKCIQIIISAFQDIRDTLKEREHRRKLNASTYNTQPIYELEEERTGTYHTYINTHQINMSQHTQRGIGPLNNYANSITYGCPE